MEKCLQEAAEAALCVCCRGKKIAMDVARGIDKMHSRRLVHLDLKSPNILLSASGTAKIAVRTCPVGVGLGCTCGRDQGWCGRVKPNILLSASGTARFALRACPAAPL